ncbi:MAG: C40 family peptidase [Clostridia bacterium]|nr:C40 family peptidase [Clostridia bacterium]
MKPLKTAVCAIALMLGCLPLTACSGRSDDTANKENFEQVEEGGEVVTLPGDIQIPEPEKPEIPQEPQTPQAQYILVRTNGLNVRAGAGMSSEVLGTVENGVLLQYVGQTNGWYETRYKGRTAYVSADARYTSLTSMEAGSEKIESVIQEGLKVLGTPYVYGAVRLHDGKGNLLKNFTDTAFDCSSLMQYMFYRGAGVNLNMNTRTQVSQGQEVAKKDIQRGDLLFFTNASRYNNTGLERIGHVALYLGDNYILHTASDYAKIEQISTTRWSYYITARRVL